MCWNNSIMLNSAASTRTVDFMCICLLHTPLMNAPDLDNLAFVSLASFGLMRTCVCQSLKTPVMSIYCQNVQVYQKDVIPALDTNARDLKRENG